jgi:excisionase family DNA binding protein
MYDMNQPRSIFADLTTAARDYNLSKRTLWKFITAGTLRAYQPTRTILVKRSELEAFIERTHIHKK